MSIISAIFEDGREARLALEWLRERGVPQEAITVVTGQSADDPIRDYYPQEEQTVADVQDHPTVDTGKGAAQGAAVGAGVGLLFGLAAILIPASAPFIIGGALATGSAGATLAAGALAGATAGSVAGIFTTWGIPEEDANYYAGEVERGGTYVGVNLDHTEVTSREIATEFARLNGRVRGGDPEHPAEVDKVARGTLVGPAAVSASEPVLDTVENRPPARGNILETESTIGYETPGGHYKPALVGTADEHKSMIGKMKAANAEDRPAGMVDEEEEDLQAHRRPLV